MLRAFNSYLKASWEVAKIKEILICLLHIEHSVCLKRPGKYSKSSWRDACWGLILHTVWLWSRGIQSGRCHGRCGFFFVSWHVTLDVVNSVGGGVDIIFFSCEVGWDSSATKCRYRKALFGTYLSVRCWGALIDGGMLPSTFGEEDSNSVGTGWQEYFNNSLLPIFDKRKSLICKLPKSRVSDDTESLSR